MARALLATLALFAVLFTVSADGQEWDNQRAGWKGDDWRFPRKPIHPPRKPRNPCDHCKACIAIDYYERPGTTKCKECEEGYILRKGFCVRKPCVCPKNYSPVCGSDGHTYGNLCLAKCKKVDIECKGKCPCKPACICPAIYKPICGRDGKPYGNECQANCAGVKKECDGKCPCKPKACPRCPGNPCEGKVCWKHPQAQCRIKDCSCEHEFVLWKRVVDCDEKPPVIPPPICPYGRPQVQCLVDPCQVTKCDAFPHAKCRANYCGGCHADFFVKGRKVNCDKKVCKHENNPCHSNKDCCKGMECCNCSPVETHLTYYPIRQGYCTKWCDCKLRG